MGLRINAAIGLNTQRQVGQTEWRLTQGLERLGSQLRINRAADDAAGLAIAERFRSQIRQFQAEVGGLQTGVNVVQTADAALGTQQEGVQRLRELALQASNGTLTDEQRAALNSEAQQILEEIGATGENTEFNGVRLLNGENTFVPITAGGAQGVNLEESTLNSLGLTGLDLSTQAGAEVAITAADSALNAVSQNRAGLGAQESRFERAINQRETATLNAQEAESRIRGLDLARQTIEQTRNQILLGAGVNALLRGTIAPQTASRLLSGV